MRKVAGSPSNARQCKKPFGKIGVVHYTRFSSVYVSKFTLFRSISRALYMYVNSYLTARDLFLTLSVKNVPSDRDGGYRLRRSRKELGSCRILRAWSKDRQGTVFHAITVSNLLFAPSCSGGGREGEREGGRGCLSL